MANPQFSRKASKVTMDHQDRTSKTYQVFESELSHISTFNAWATLFLSLASGCATIVIALCSNLFVTDSPSAIALQYGRTLEYIFGAGCIVFVALAGASILSRRSELHRIKRESGEETGSIREYCWAILCKWLPAR